MASTRLQRTPSSSGSNSKFTFSAWVKRTIIYVFSPIFSAGSSGQSQIVFTASDQLAVYDGSTVILKTTRVFQDTSAWYHIVVTLDATQSGTDKAKLYVNGVQETSFATDGRSSFSSLAKANQSGQIQDIGGDGAGNFDGLMSHIHMTDNYAYQASTFGSTDATTGEWKINTNPSVSYGTNGFFILKDGNGITDQSGQSNNFAVNAGTLSSTIDCPSNVYSTWNYLSRSAASGIQNGGWGNGATYVATSTDNNHRSFGSTLAFPGTGKFYGEFKIGNLGGYIAIGIMEAEAANKILSQTDTGNFSSSSVGYSYRNDGNKETGGSSTSYGNSYTSMDYVGVAYNNGALWFSKNGTWQNSATISEIAAGTTTNAAFTGISTTKDYHFMFRGHNDSMIDGNFGNGWFRTTEVGSPNNPSSGDTAAKFKYAVPTAFQPLSTKGLNS